MYDRRRVLNLGGLSLAAMMTGCAGPQGRVTAPRIIPQVQPDLIRDLQERSFRFFWETTDADTGLAPDRWPTPSFASIAAVGFALTAYPVGVVNGWITREEARARTLTTLTFFANAPQGPGETGFSGYKGFFYHFLGVTKGLRFAKCELSTIDTALLLGGMLILKGQLSLGQLVAAELILSGVFYGISQLGWYLDTFYDLAASSEELSLLFAIPQEPNVRGDNGPRDGAVKMTDVVFDDARYNLALAAGDQLVTVAEPGAERRLAMLLKRHCLPDRGLIQIGGSDLGSFDMYHLRSDVTVLDRSTIVEVTIREYLRLASGELVQDAMKTLRGKAKVKRAMWSRRAQEYEQKINSGDIIAIAEVVRDLHRTDDQREQSYSERQIFEGATSRLARELAAMEQVDEPTAQEKILEILRKAAAIHNKDKAPA